MIYLSDFTIVRPKFEGEQERGFEWILKAHCYSSLKKEEIQEKLNLVGCKKKYIQRRGYSLDDFNHNEWNKMSIYNLIEKKEGRGQKERTLFFKDEVERVFAEFYPNSDNPPSDLIHVTCTGYTSPSAAQTLVARNKWPDTVVTHAYHMGCLAALPAFRMAQGFLASKEKKRVDIIHSEICTLHLNPSINTAEQFVAETLFADGFIKYSCSQQKTKKSFSLLALHEVIIPGSEKAMEWQCEDWGMRMTLSKEIPVHVSRNIQSFIDGLCQKAGCKAIERAIFAIHPGGPKIIDQIVAKLNLQEWQVEASREVLKMYGNMSSATVPHILEAILASPKYEKECIVIALAFGPGITISGAILRKE